MIGRTECVRVAIIGSGLLARHLYELAPQLGAEVVGGGTTSTSRLGDDLGVVLGMSPCGVTYTGIDEVLARTDLDVVLHAGPGGENMWTLLEACARRGIDVITSAGAFEAGGDEPTRERAGALDAMARTSGARLLGTGIFPGFSADTLPLLLASTVPDPVVVEVRQTSDITTWSGSVLRHEIGVGDPPSQRSGRLLAYVEAAARTMAEGLQIEGMAWESSNAEVPASGATRVGEVAVEPGHTVGFRYVVQGHDGSGVRVSVAWQSAEDGEPLGTEITLRGSMDVVLKVRVSPFSAYAATATRILNAIRPLRTLPGGLQRGFRLPIAP